MKRKALASFDKNGKFKDVIDIFDSGSSFGRGSGGAKAPFVQAMFPDRKSDSMNFQSAFGERQIPARAQVNPEDCLYAPFRLISATIVGAGSWKCTDFSNEAVLRASMPLLQNKPVYRDHMMYPDYWAGIVDSLSWTAAFVQGGGPNGALEIPAGIDGLLAIDTQSDENANLARGIVMGAVRSNSVTVEFEWEPSHQFPDEWSFYEFLGTIVDGRMVARVVTNIIEYHETSIVGLGADPYAKAINEQGELVDVDLANTNGLAIRNGEGLSDEEVGERAQSFRKVVSAFSKRSAEKPHLIVSAKTAQQNFSNFIDNPQNYLKQMADKNKSTENFGAKLGGLLDQLVASQVEAKGVVRQTVINQMAEAAGLSERSVRRYINAESSCPSPVMLAAWADVLQTTPQVLMQAALEDGCTINAEDVSAAVIERQANAKTQNGGVQEEEEMAKSSNGNVEDDDMMDEHEEEMNKATASNMKPNTVEEELEECDEMMDDKNDEMGLPKDQMSNAKETTSNEGDHNITVTDVDEADEYLEDKNEEMSEPVEMSKTEEAQANLIKEQREAMQAMQKQMEMMMKMVQTTQQQMAGTEQSQEQSVEVTTEQSQEQEVVPSNDSKDVSMTENKKENDNPVSLGKQQIDEAINSYKKGLQLQIEAKDERIKELEKKLRLEKQAYTDGVKGYEMKIDSLDSKLRASYKETEELEQENSRNAAELEALRATKKSYTELQEKHQKAELDLAGYKAQQHFIEIGKEHFEAMKAEAIRLYRAATGTGVSEAVVNLFKNAKDMSAINGLVEQYGKRLASQFSFRCNSCGGTEYSFASVVSVGGQEDVTKVNDTEMFVDDDALRHEFSGAQTPIENHRKRTNRR